VTEKCDASPITDPGIRIGRALFLAKHYHDGQQYGGYPYMKHLMDVFHSVRDAHPEDFQAQAVAWLHDILEDTDCTLEELQCFGSEICDAVDALTFDPDIETRNIYLARVRANILALRVKIHDTLCNLNACIQEANYNRAKRYSKQLAELLS